MAYFDSYDAIVSSVSEMAEDDSLEFMNFIPKSIRLAELRLMDELDVYNLSTQYEVTCTPSSRFITKPNDIHFVNYCVAVVSGGVEVPLKLAKADYLRDYWPNPSTTGVPEYYSEDYSDASWLIAPTPSSAYVLRFDLQRDAAAISSGNQTSILTQKYGNALFYATMIEQASFMKSPEIRAEFEAKYNNAIQAVNNRGRRDRRQNGGSSSFTESGSNTLLGTR